MGNRIEEGVCLMCGGPLIEINDYHTCYNCTRKIQWGLYEVRKKAQKGHNFKKTGTVIQKGQIGRQTVPIGKQVD